MHSGDLRFLISGVRGHESLMPGPCGFRDFGVLRVPARAMMGAGTWAIKVDVTRTKAGYHHHVVQHWVWPREEYIRRGAVSKRGPQVIHDCFSRRLQAVDAQAAL